MVLGIARVLLKIAADGRLQKSASYQLSLSYLISDTQGKHAIYKYAIMIWNYYFFLLFFFFFLSPLAFTYLSVLVLAGLESKVPLNIHRIDALQTEGVPDCVLHFCHQKLL